MTSAMESIVDRERREHRERWLLELFLARLAKTHALAVPASDLQAAVDDTLKETNR